MNTMRHELNVKHNINVTPDMMQDFTNEMQSKYNISVLRYEVDGKTLVVYTKEFKLGKKEFKSLLDKIRINDEPIKVYIEDDVQDFYRSTTWNKFNICGARNDSSILYTIDNHKEEGII